LSLAPPQKSSKFVDESTTLPLHTSKTLDGLHKLLPLLLHTKKKPNDQKKTKSGSLSRGPCVPGVFWRFFPDFFKKSRFFLCLKNRAFFKSKNRRAEKRAILPIFGV
jgi:hypothetical protein